MDSFYQKYLKYKNKYSKIKKQIGGGMIEATVELNSIEFTMEFPESLCCPITFELLEDPVTTIEGFTYNRNWIEQYFSRSNISPSTNELIENKSLIPNYDIREIIEELKREGYQNFLQKQIDDLSQRADTGDPNAQFELALKFISGDDFLKKDVSKAIELLRKASSVGHPGAITFLQRIESSSEPRENIFQPRMSEDGGMAASLHMPVASRTIKSKILKRQNAFNLYNNISDLSSQLILKIPSEQCVDTMAFFNRFIWTIVHPDSQKKKELETQYNSGVQLDIKKIKIPISVVDNINNWTF